MLQDHPVHLGGGCGGITVWRTKPGNTAIACGRRLLPRGERFLLAGAGRVWVTIVVPAPFIRAPFD